MRIALSGAPGSIAGHLTPGTAPSGEVPRPDTPYGRSKWGAERAVRAAGARSGALTDLRKQAADVRPSDLPRPF